MDYYQQNKRNCQLPAKRLPRMPFQDIGADTSTASQRSTWRRGPPVHVPVSSNDASDSENVPIEDKKARWGITQNTFLADLNCLNSIAVNQEDGDVSRCSSTSVELFDDEDEEGFIIQEQQSLEHRIRSAQRKKHDTTQQHEKERRDKTKKQNRDIESMERIKLKILNLEKNVEEMNKEKKEALSVSIFYEPVFKIYKIDPMNPTCRECKSILLTNTKEGSVTCDFWNCPGVSGNSKGNRTPSDNR